MRPFFSILFAFLVLFGVMFVKMDNRRMGYELYKLSRERKVAESKNQLQSINFARLIRPERIERYAETYLELKRASRQQVIQITSPQVVVRD